MIDKNIFLKLFNDLDSANKLYNLLSMSLEYGVGFCSDIFVTPNIWKKLNNKYENVYVYLSGFDRKQVCFSPYEPEFNYSILEIRVLNNFKQLSHKDFLGSIMGLNIKRELLGDIFAENNTAYVFVSNSIKEYIKSNLTEVGKNSCIVSETSKKEFNYNFEEFTITISSNRLDNFISKITNLSRGKVDEIINAGLVMVDYEICSKKNITINEETILSIRKFGKFLIKQDLGINKKGKNKWIIFKYI